MRNQIVCVLLALVCTIQAFSVSEWYMEEWNIFKDQYKKEYKSHVEEKYRFKIYMENSRKIAEHNAKFERGEVGFTLKMNQFGDKLISEVVRENGMNQLDNEVDSSGSTFIRPANVELPDRVDWREKGAVTPVKSQGECGSDWAFSATGALEAQMFRKTGVLTSLSEQNLMDCTVSYGNMGCLGGSQRKCFQYIEKNGGIDTEASYPYRKQIYDCVYNPAHSAAKITGHVNIPCCSEETLKEAVAVHGPVATTIDGAHYHFVYYSEGIYYDAWCRNDTVNHGILVVGYGTENGTDYWLIKNSWDTTWGIKGYAKLARNRDDMCGIAYMASYPLV